MACALAVLGLLAADTVDVWVEGGSARVVVTRPVDQAEAQPIAQVSFQAPEGGSFVSLAVKDGARWIEGRLLLAEAARRRFDALIRPGPAEARTSALLEAEGTSFAHAEVFPVGPRRPATLRVGSLAPMRWEDGHHVLVVPLPREPAPRFRLHGATGETTFDEEQGAWTIRLQPPPIDRLAARLAVARLSSGREVVRLEVEAAPALARVADDLVVVFVIDASYSEGRLGIGQQLSLVRGYLAAAPQARFEIVLYRRRAERLIGRFAAPAELDGVLARAAFTRLEPANGSNLDEGLRAAAAALQGTRGTPRVVAMTDARLKEALDAGALAAALRDAPPGTLLHLVERAPTNDEAIGLERDDEHPLAEVALATGGMLVHAFGDTGILADLEAAARELVRPTRLHHVEATAGGFDAAELGAPVDLGEGEGFQVMTVLDQAPRSVRVSGWLWGTRWERTVAPDAGLTARLPALALGGDLDLDEEETAALAHAGRVLSSAWSFLAAAPDARPGKEGIEIAFGGTGGSGTMRGRSGSGDTFGSARPDAPLFDERGWLTRALAQAARRCGVTRATIDVETTGDEIVEATAPASRCLEEEAWALRLPRTFSSGRRRFTITLGR